MTTLTDRYVEATLRRLPGRQRPDIERELRSSIADAIDDRVAGGEDPATAETAVLAGLGDPARLAASYANGPLHLIGPELYVDYTRVLTTLLATVVPIVAAVVASVRLFNDAPFGDVIGGAVGGAITTAVHIAVWVTLLFAVLERTGKGWNPLQPWTPSALPMPPSRRARIGELTGLSVATVVFSAFVLLSPMFRFQVDADGDPIPALAPWLFETGIVYVYVALSVASLGFAFARHYTRWNLPTALAGMLVQMAPAVLLIWLAANDRVVNPAFIEATGWPETATRWIAPGLMIAGATGVLSAITETVRNARNR